MMLDGGVADISRSRTVPAEPQAVWDILADFGALASWAGGVDHSCVLNHGPDGTPVGTTRRVQVGRTALVERITEFDPPVTLAYAIEGLPARLGKAANRWTLRPAGAAGAVTLVTLTSMVEIGANPPARMAAWVALRVLAHRSDAMLAGLAHRLENAHA